LSTGHLTGLAVKTSTPIADSLSALPALSDVITTMAPDDGKPVGWFGLTEFQLLLAFFLVLLAAVTIVIIVVCVIRSCDIRCQRCPLNADNETSSEEGRGDSSSKSSIQIVVSDTRTVFAERIQSDERSGNLVAQI
jgi:hypothetical protein